MISSILLPMIAGLAASVSAAPSPSPKAADAQPGLCLAFQDNFDDILDTKVWTQDVTMGGGGNWEFEYYTNNRSNAYTENGHLYIKPTMTHDLLGDAMINGGSLDLWASGCTSNGFYGCSRSSNGANIINPIQSALLRTVNSVSFKYGKVEVRAKIPKGDWIWPAIWLLPKDQAYGGWPASGEIDIMESRGNAPGCAAGSTNCVAGSDTYGSTLHWGPDYFTNRFPTTTKSYTIPNGSLGDDFHIYGLLWTNTSLITYIDSPENVVLSVPLGDFCAKGNFPPSYKCPWPSSRVGAPFDQEFYLIMNVAVGGTNSYFPDMPSKPWSNTSPHAALDFWNGRASWQPTWSDQSALVVDSVNIYKEC